LIEGLSIGVGAVIKPGLALLIALAIIINNLAESLSTVRS
jgi:ZIP family zinc transporter